MGRISALALLLSTLSCPNALISNLAARKIGFGGFSRGVTRIQTSMSAVPKQASSAPAGGQKQRKKEPLARVVLVAGFEAFNRGLYKEVAARLEEVCPEMEVLVFTDREIADEREAVAAALENADAFFASLVFDYDQVQFLASRIERIPVRLVFESALELMKFTRLGDFSMAGSGGSGGGPPAPVKALLSRFGSGREEDRLAGYLKLLKVGPSLLRFFPGKKASDLRSWLEIYSFWNQGGPENVLSMFLTLGDRYLLPPGVAPKPEELRETPALGLTHPDADRYFATPKEYLDWYLSDPKRKARAAGAPRVAVLLYRKHVVTGQRYISQLTRYMEDDGLLPVPIFINGVEAHTVVRDLLTSDFEQETAQSRRRSAGVFAGGGAGPALSSGAVKVDAIVNTVGFPLVGGPAGSMEAGRRVDVAQQLLGEKNVPYIVAAPLLIQDLRSWRRDGVQGLQQVVLYSLPELDGAVDTVVLGGLVGDRIALVPERVRKLDHRIQGWVHLRRTPPAERRVAVLLYGFPPNVGAVGTAALLNVPKSLEALLQGLLKQGYDLGPDGAAVDGEALVAALKVISQDSVVAKGYAALQPVVDHASSLGEEYSYRVATPAGLGGARVSGAGLPTTSLEEYLSKRMVRRMEKGWGDLDRYRGVATTGTGELVVAGLQLGNVWLGVQPVLGIEGDPMRLLFQRDLTPHPQYAALYQWLKSPRNGHNGGRRINGAGGGGSSSSVGSGTGFGADALVHLGMHGTVEWLPGSPLGNTYETWPDLLMGGVPNVYIYAANNPSESILAKRRGYGTIVSHNVPPYARAGLYKELASLRELLSEYREAPAASAGLRPVIAAQLKTAGLFEDRPYPGPSADVDGAGSSGGVLSPEAAEAMSAEEVEEFWDPYVLSVSDYLQVLEQRLFSEGLHVLGSQPSPQQLQAYLSAYFGDDLPEAAVEAVAKLPLGARAEEAASAVRALGPEFSGVTAVDSGRVSVLTAHEAGGKGPVAAAAPRPLSPEEAYEDTLLYGDYFRWQWLKLLRALGNEKAKREIAEAAAISERTRPVVAPASRPDDSPALVMSRQIAEAADIKALLERSTEELDAALAALNGEYVQAGVGGDLLRDGPGVLPTGRNIHALDPYRMPSAAAWARGSEAARKILEGHAAANNGMLPETVAVMLWGLDAIKTRGESVAIALALVGARPVREGTGRVVKYELVPLAELGRPRVDVLGSMSGIFRDSFANVVDLLDDLFEQAAAADEPPELNYIRKHALMLAAKGIDRPASRLFSNPAGDFGSMVNERVGSGDWDDGESLGSTWQSRNGFSYGRGGERGQARPELMEALLSTTDRVVQEIDSVEYGLTDIQEYFANSGAAVRAANSARRRAGRDPSGTGKGVGMSVVEAFGKRVEPVELDAALRVEYRTKLVNPKWAAAMAAQGSGGAYEISQRMTALIGWSGTTEFQDKWVYDGAAERYALDEEMAAKLRKANPEAFQNILKRMLEASGRGFWSPEEKTLRRIQEMYADVEDDIEVGSGAYLKMGAQQQ